MKNILLTFAIALGLALTTKAQVITCIPCEQISKIHFTTEGEFSNYLNFLKKFEIRTERPTKNKPTQMSGFSFKYSFL